MSQGGAVNLDSEDLIEQFGKDWPAELELSRLRLLVVVQDAEIKRLTALQPPAYDPTSVRPYVGTASIDLEEGGRHGG
jgi:hypothetical protein